MSGANNILPFCPTDTGTNLLTQAAYLAAAGRTQGNQPGTASSALVNKSLRQASLVAAAVAQYIADRQLVDLVDTDTAANIASYFETAMINKTIAVVGGTADAITLAMTPTATALVGGLVGWRATAANATTTPTVKRDGLAAKTLVKGNNQAVAVTDIPGAGAWMWSQYDATLDKEVLLNPANGVGAGSGRQLQPIATPTQSAGSMTLPSVSMTLDFRNASNNLGGVTTVTGAPAAFTIPASTPLGAINATPSTLIDIVLNNAGTLERAVANLAAGIDLSENGVITTKAITDGCTFTGSIAVTTGILTLTTPSTGSLALGMSLLGTGVASGTVVLSLLTGTQGAAGSTYQTNQFIAVASTTLTGSAGFGVYSAAARTAVPYRVVGRYDATQATAGTYATLPTLVQGAGGLSLAALSSFGYGQTWKNMTASRAGGVTYYNTTGKPISIAINCNAGVSGSYIMTANVGGSGSFNFGGGVQGNGGAYDWAGGLVIPAGASYVISGYGLNTWYELR